MAIKNTFREVAIKNSKKQPIMVDQLLEEAPILDMIPFEASTDGTTNVYEELNSVTGAGMVDLDDELPEVDSDSKLKQIDLSVIGGRMFVPEDKAKKLGGAAAYFNKKYPAILRQTGMDAEQTILYNNIRAKSLANGLGEHAINAGGVGNTNYTVLAVKWVPGETTGLYDPTGFGKGLLMDMEAINGGQLYESSVTFDDSRTKKLLGYGMRMKTYFGIQLANARYVSSIVNIDIVNSKLPTEAQIDDLIASVRGSMGGSTFLYMHPKVYTAFFKYKSDKLELQVGDKDMTRSFNTWDGIPIMTSYNFLKGTEPLVS